MKKSRLILALSSFVVLGLAGCGQPPSKPSGSVVVGNVAPGTGGSDAVVIDPATGKPVSADGLPMELSLASFKANLYEPLLQPFCSECHATTFAGDDLTKAHGEFLVRAGFNRFTGIEQTLPVLKMHESHNCWAADVKTCTSLMTDKMKLWLGDLESAGFKTKGITYPHTSSQVALTAIAPVVLPIPQEYVGAGIDKATQPLPAPFTMATNDVDGAIKSYATSPPATARLNAANAAQAITFTMDAKVAGTYFVWARVKTLADANNEFFIQANAANAVAFAPPVTGKDAWKWAQVTVTANNVTTPFSFAVAAPGPQTMRVLFREGGASINYLVITTKPDFNGDQFANNFFDISVPLTVPGAEGSKISATVWEKTTAEGKKSLGVKELKITSPVPLHIKTIYPLINGMFSANNGTYTLVDTIAGGPDPAKAVISTGGSTASTWLTDIAVDKLSFAFEVLEVAK